MQRTNRTVERVALGAALVITTGLCYLNAVTHGQPAEEAPAAAVPVEANLSPAAAKIYAALDEPTKLAVMETSLSDVTAYLAKMHDIPIVLHARALDDLGIGSDTPITIHLQNVRLRSALRLMLKELELTVVVRNEVLLITTVEQEESLQVTHVYDVRDLMLTPESEEPDADLLIELTTTAVAPHTWNDVGGPASIAHFDGSLVISQTDELHRQVQGVFTQLRQARHAMQHRPETAFARRWPASAALESEANQAIRDALQKPVPKMEFVETSLSDVVIYLAEKTAIPIVIDARCLDGVGIGSDTPVTCHLQGVSLQSALNLILAELELTYVVRDDVLLITTLEEAESQLNTAIFLVRDLLEGPATAGGDVDSLIAMITATIAPDTWDFVGGAGSAAHFAPIDALVVSQTDRNLEQVESLLGKLRKLRQARQPWSADQWEAQQQKYLATPRYQVYYISRDANGLLAIDHETAVSYLTRLLDKDLVERANLRKFDSAVTMFLNPKQAAEVDRALRQSGLPIYRQNPFGMGFGGAGFSGGGGFGPGGMGGMSGGGFGGGIGGGGAGGGVQGGFF